MRKIVFGVGLAALIASVIAAVAANTTFFTSIGDIVFPFSPPNGSGLNGSIGDPVRGGMAPVNGNLSYTKVAAGTGFSYTFVNFQADMLFEPAGTLAAGYVTAAPTPTDGAQECVFSTQAITAFYWAANVGQTINNAITALSANTRVCYRYSIGNATWDRSN